LHRIPCITAHCIASRASQRIASQHIASHPVHRSAPRERQVLVSQVADRSELRILKDNQVSKIMAVVFVNAQAPILAVEEDLLVITQTPFQ
jgi:hypothetical protein